MTVKRDFIACEKNCWEKIWHEATHRINNFRTISGQLPGRGKIVNDYLTKNRRYIMKDYSFIYFQSSMVTETINNILVD